MTKKKKYETLDGHKSVDLGDMDPKVESVYFDELADREAEELEQIEITREAHMMYAQSILDNLEDYGLI